MVRVPLRRERQRAHHAALFRRRASVTTLLDEAPSIEVVRLVPKFDKPIVLERTAVGKSITLTGENLDKIDRILVGGFEAVVSKQPASLTFTVPAGNFQDGDTTTSLVAKYFDETKRLSLSEAFVVYVPFVKFWENITVWGHDKELSSMPATSRPKRVVSMLSRYGLLNWIRSQPSIRPIPARQPLTPNVTEEEYNSVVPYFFFYCNGSGNVNITAPANSAGILKNFCTRIRRANWSDGWSQRQLLRNPRACIPRPESSNATESALIEKVKNQTLEQIARRPSRSMSRLRPWAVSVYRRHRAPEGFELVQRLLHTQCRGAGCEPRCRDSGALL